MKHLASEAAAVGHARQRQDEVSLSMTLSSVTIQIAPQSRPSTPSFLGEMAAFAQVLTHTGSLKAIQEQVRFARARFGQYKLIDFVAVLIGYILSGEPTLLAFYERLAPFAEPFMALFERSRLLVNDARSKQILPSDVSTCCGLPERVAVTY